MKHAILFALIAAFLTACGESTTVAYVKVIPPARVDRRS